MARNQQRAFTINELIVILAVVGIVALLPLMLSKTYVNTAQGNCSYNLKTVGLAFQIFATDHNDMFPMQVSTNEGGAKEWSASQAQAYRVFQSLSNELGTPRLLRCRLDTRSHATDFITFGNSNISYFIGVDAEVGQPARLLAGDRNIRVNVPMVDKSVLALQTNHFLWWTKDMHVASVKKRTFFGQIEYTITSQTVPQGNVVMADGSVQLVDDEGLLSVHRKTGLMTNHFLFPD